MNQPSTPSAPAATEATPSGVPSLEERIASVTNDLDAAPSQAAGELGEASPPAVPQVPPVASGDAAAQQRAAERRAASMVDVSGLDEAAFFALAEQKGIDPNKLGTWIRDALTNPEKRAEAAALQAQKSTYDPKLAALEARIAEQQARIDAFTAEQEKGRAAQEEERQTKAFLGFVAQSTERAPMAARLLQTDPEEFIQMASIAAESVAGMGPEALLDAVEELLDGPTRAVAQKYAALYGITSQPTAPSQPTTRGAAQPNTVSNSLAQQRVSLVDEDDFAKLPIEERAARLIRSM